MSSDRKEQPAGRPYRMQRRADHVDATRQRIIEAAVDLHGSIGPAATTVMGIADLAGVTRATVYRHFPDDDALYAACSAHWLAGQHPPDPTAWTAIADPTRRLRFGLTELYRFYREGEPMLSRIYRDRAQLPDSRRAELALRDAVIRDLLVAPYDAASRGGPVLTAIVGHVTSFWTWRSMCLDGGLHNDQAIDLFTALITRVARTRR
ncbi:MAG TPA: TetR/AcrR family transcriptional regulator [Mycobacteriales bacterium]|nr:TetR/AcrR family transcriptional regulator [Mycobacteriales bacterium]